MMDEFNLLDVAVGDTITVVEFYGRERAREAVVTRVGRKNLAVEQYRREQVFGREDGVEKRSANAGGSPARAYKLGEYEARQERERLLTAAYQAFNYGNGSRRNALTLDQLQRIVAVLDE